MATRSPGRPAHRAGRPASHRAAVRALTLLAALLGSAASAQERLVAVHHQTVDAAGGAPLEALVRLPPPRMGAWDAVTATASVSCLRPGALSAEADGSVLDLRLVIGGAAGPGLAPGETCRGSVVLRFTGAAGTEEVVVEAAFHRPAAPAYPGRALGVTSSVDRVSRGDVGPAGYPPAQYVELVLTNSEAGPVRVVGLAALEELRELAFEAYLLPDGGFPSSLADLEPLPIAIDAALPSGRALRLAVVFDPAARLPQDAGAAALQPALLVDRDGELFTVRFDLISSSWGRGGP